MKYNLQDFEKISFNGFNFTIPEETINLISSLSMKVGSPTYIKTPIFQKNENKDTNVFGKMLPQHALKKKARKNNEMDDAEWETIRTFHVTAIEHNIGIDGQIDKIRSCLNKLTDKTYLDMKTQIFDILNQLVADNISSEEMTRIGTTVFEIASNNKFYSKLYADIYTELIHAFPVMREVFQTNYSTFMKLFETIDYVDSMKDYDKFCENNKKNEKRKALSMFLVNLTLNGIIDSLETLGILQKLLGMVLEYISMEDKKNHVDELGENVAILYNKQVIEMCGKNINTELLVGDKSIPEVIKSVASMKTKAYPGLSSKTIFKFMDMF